MQTEYGALSYQGNPPASAAWREGFPQGNRLFFDFGPFTTDSGFTFENVTVAYQTWGVLNDDASNAIYVAHALTGDSHVTGNAGAGHVTGGWWNSLVGPGAPIDTDKYFVVCANVLGGCQGTTGPASAAPDGKAWGSRFPVITIADMVRVEYALTDFLGIGSYSLMLGPSLGGMRVLEWMVRYPEAVRGGLVLGSTAAVSAEEIGIHATQIAAIELDPHFNNGDYYESEVGPVAGMGLARRIAHLSYRSESELDMRFGRNLQGTELPSRGGLFAVESYLDHHADKLARRFDANTYIALTRAMTLFDLGEGRGGVVNALNTINAPLTVVGIDSDRLFPLRLQQDIVDSSPGADELHLLISPFGHDGFLVEEEQVAQFVGHALNRVEESTSTQ
jgi:homoserine O-acetyltransferase/O-succinyltransferase